MTNQTLGKFRSITVTLFLLFVLLLLLISFAIEEAFTRDNPGWGNAAMVCGSPRTGNDSPDLNFQGGKNAFETGFYFIGRQPDPANRFLGVDINDKVRLIPADVQSPFSWLVTGVGAGLYQISICYKGEPRCLVMSDDKKMVLGRCEHEAFGNQAWWNVGILLGPGKGGWELGNDGLGRMDCLAENPQEGIPYLTACDPSGNPQTTWRFEPEKIIQDSPHAVIPMPPKAKSSSTQPTFPAEAEVISYHCDSGERVNAYYQAESDVMKVKYKGELLVLHPVRSGSGAKYGGINKPWGWWTKGKEGSIFSYNVDGTEGEFIENCREAGPIRATNLPVQSQPAPSLDPNRKWTNSGAYEEIMLMDCDHCGDDIGLTIQCQGEANLPLVSVNWAATDKPSPADTLIIFIGKEIFERKVTTVNYGMIGHVPQFHLERNDPLITAMQKGRIAIITYGGEKTRIGLHGTKIAFDIFNAHCGWNNYVENTPLVSKPDPVAPPEPPITDQDNPDGAIWYTSEYFDDQKNTTVNDLVFGIPETDAIAMIASCGASSSTANLDLLLDTGDLQSGAPYYVRLQTADYDQTHKAEVFFDNSEYAGVRFSLPISEPLWNALLAGETFYIVPQIGSDRELKHSASVDAVGVWLDQCNQ